MPRGGPPGASAGGCVCSNTLRVPFADPPAFVEPLAVGCSYPARAKLHLGVYISVSRLVSFLSLLELCNRRGRSIRSTVSTIHSSLSMQVLTSLGTPSATADGGRPDRSFKVIDRSATHRRRDRARRPAAAGGGLYVSLSRPRPRPQPRPRSVPSHMHMQPPLAG